MTKRHIIQIKDGQRIRVDISLKEDVQMAQRHRNRLSVISHQRNANQSRRRPHLTPTRITSTWFFRCLSPWPVDTTFSLWLYVGVCVQLSSSKDPSQMGFDHLYLQTHVSEGLGVRTSNIPILERHNLALNSRPWNIPQPWKGMKHWTCYSMDEPWGHPWVKYAWWKRTNTVRFHLGIQVPVAIKRIETESITVVTRG